MLRTVEEDLQIKHRNNSASAFQNGLQTKQNISNIFEEDSKIKLQIRSIEESLNTCTVRSSKWNSFTVTIQSSITQIVKLNYVEWICRG
jgi:hypothetical protein